ncbi:MAG: hypothetical protein HOF21_12035 [Nitrospina sp.]|nr:hypothetical protein [Nitrospina sp.]
MQENLRANFKKALEHMGQGNLEGQGDALIFREGLWADITQKGEDTLKDRMFNDPNTDVDWIKARKFFVDYLGDAISYFKGKVTDIYSQYNAIQKRMDGLIEDLSSDTNPNQNTLLTVVSHSLGTVVLSDYLYDKRDILEPKYQLTFSNFFTLGSPIALYANRFYNHQSKSNPFANFKPQKVKDPNGIWVNLFDEDDIVGYPIRPVNSHCKKVVTADLNVSVGSFLAGGTPASHTGYWEDEEVGKIIAEKLAIDWLRVNGWDDKTKSAKRITKYKERYNMPSS